MPEFLTFSVATAWSSASLKTHSSIRMSAPAGTRSAMLPASPVEPPDDELSPLESES